MSASNMALLQCPMCTFSVLPSDDYVLQLHFEQVHTEDSPFRLEDDPEALPPPLPARPSAKRPKCMDNTPSEDEEENSVFCPEPGCGELVFLTDFNDHFDYHTAETLSFDETTGKYHSRQSSEMHGLTTTANSTGSSKPSFLEQNFDTALPNALRRNDNSGRKQKKARGRGASHGNEKSTLSRSIASFFDPFANIGKKVKPPQSKTRLGKEELGPHAYEDRMPGWLHDQLARGPRVTVINRIGRDGRLIKQEQVENETPGIIPILAQLSALDRSVKEAYYCHPSTLHIGKTQNEGGFCGYRNIQMLISYIQGAHAQGMDEFPGRTPGILKLQDLIERAWDKGINDIGRAQTGGIKDTRKYIGTPEAQALFLSSQIDCAVQLIVDSPDGELEAHEQLFVAVERYFAQAAVKDGSNVYKTLLPPIYLQHPGHSITIIGFERHRDGSCNLMIFDPIYRTSPAMHRLIGRKNIKTDRPEVLYMYRRVAKQLKRHAAFEVLMLTAHPPLLPVWDVLRQFPDCRFLYVFFRSRTLGYDVYPEDHFLRNFPWQQYGGLWIVDEARFARSDKMSPLTAQALRRVTSEGSSSGSSMVSGTNESFNGGSFNQLHSPSLRVTRSGPFSRLPSSMSSLDGSLGGTAVSSKSDPLDPVLNMVGMHTALPEPSTVRLQQPSLSLVTELGRRYPGYPSPLSPTFDAKYWYPSPNSESGSGIVTPRAASSITRLGSPMSIDGSEMCGPSRRCESHGYGHYTFNTNRWDTTTIFEDGNPTPFGTNMLMCASPVSDGRSDALSPSPSQRNATRSPSASSISPTSPPRAVSPRTAMLKDMFGKHTFQNMSHISSLSPPNVKSLWAAQPEGSIATSFAEEPQNLCCKSSPHPTPDYSSLSLSPPTISIAHGTETSTVSPISLSGTMLSYTSNRAVDSGLLAVQPLSEAQVAEYRFWRPCGRRACAFGCGEGGEGECSAAKRLFREEEVVKLEEPEVDDDAKNESYEP